MMCEMCGKEGPLFRTSVEYTEMNVCKTCSRHGTVIKRVMPPVKVKKLKKQAVKEAEKEVIQIIVADYSALIKQARETMGLTQEEFSQKLNEKESIIQKIESAHFKPNLRLAKKLEKYCRIKLVEEYEEDYTSAKKTSPENFTIGDFIKVKNAK